jgi:hypothetical protein
MRPSISGITSFLAAVALAAGFTSSAQAAFHFWHVKEVFSNADGTVQFIELFNSSVGEWQVASKVLRTNSDGVIKNFTIPANLPSSPSTVNTHMLLATPLFSMQTGAVTPNYTLPDPTVPANGLFFNPDATSITITFLGSGDFMTFPGASLPTDGYHSLTDLNASGFEMGNDNDIEMTVNSPTRFPNTAGQIDLRPPPMIVGDYNGDDFVTAADYTKWRNNLGGDPSVFPAGSRGPGMLGPIALGDYTFWKLNYGNDYSSMGAGSGASTAVAVPEPATAAILSVSLLGIFSTRRWKRRSIQR